MPRKRVKAPKRMLQDLHEAAKAHGWSGSILVPNEAFERAADSASAAAGVASASGPCLPGQSLQTIQVLRPDGTVSVIRVCM